MGWLTSSVSGGWRVKLASGCYLTHLVLAETDRIEPAGAFDRLLLGESLDRDGEAGGQSRVGGALRKPDEATRREPS
jgi:hypothetical protein